MRWTIERDETRTSSLFANAHKDMRYLANMANASGAVNSVQAVVKNALRRWKLPDRAKGMCRCWPISSRR